MGSYEFNSPEGRSKVHANILEEIINHKEFEWVDKEFLHRFSDELYEDYFWIEGVDRRYFAERIRSILATEPVGEWTDRGRADNPDNKEWLSFKAHCAVTDTRFPGLLAIAEHLEETDETPVVITYSVTADFPSPEFLPDGSTLDLAEADENEAWAVTFPELKRKRPDLKLLPAGDMMELALAGPLKHGIDIQKVISQALIYMAIRNPDPHIREKAYMTLGDAEKSVVDGAEFKPEDEETLETLPVGLEAVPAEVIKEQPAVKTDDPDWLARRVAHNRAVMEALLKLDDHSNSGI